MKAFSYDSNGRYLGQVMCQIDPIRSKKENKGVYLLPANSTFTEVPQYDDSAQIPVWNGASWEITTIPSSDPTPPTHEEINKMIVAKIREKYDVNEEFKMINLGITDPNNEDYVAYREYVQSCIDWGNELETEAAQALE